MTPIDIIFLTLFIITDLLNCILCYNLVFGMELAQKKVKWLLAVLIVFVFHIVIAAVSSALKSADFSIVSMLVVPWLLVSGNRKERYGLYLFIFLGMSSIGSIAMLVFSLLSGIGEQILLSSYFPFLLCQTIPSLFLILLFLFLKLRKKKVQKVFLGLKTYILFYVTIACVMLIQACFQGLCSSENDSPIIVLYGLVSSAASLVFLIAVLWHGITINREMELNAQISSLIQINKLKEEYFNQAVSHNEEMRRFRHDAKGHLLALMGYCNDGDVLKAGEYLEKITSKLNPETTHVYTHDNGVDAVIGSLYNQARGKNIEMKISGSMKLNNSLSSFEWSSIFYNLTQNAIEACEKLPAESDRTICVSMAVVNNHNVISIKNPVLKNVLISGGRIETGKADKFSHGIGTVNVTDIVEKHGGTVKFSCENNIFNADVII